MTSEPTKPERESKSLVDRDLIEISTYCEKHLDQVRNDVRTDVETEMYLSCERPSLDDKGFCDARSVLPYLNCMRKTLEGMLSDAAPRFSKARWLWMLRRVPDFVFEGKISTTRAYQSALADAVSGAFGSEKSDLPFKDSEGSTRFRLDGSALPRLLRFAELVRWLNQSHVLLRYSGKGVRFRFEQKSLLPSATPTKEEDNSIRKYDERAADWGSPFARVGTAITAKTEMSDGGFWIVYFSNPDWVMVPVHVNGKETKVKILKRFLPESVSLDGLSALNNDARLSGLSWWAPLAATALALSRGMFRIVTSNYNGFASLLRYGYVFMDLELFMEVMAEGWNLIVADVLRVIPNATLPQSPAELFANLIAVQPNLWPLSLGPIVRQAGDLVWIDLVACTAALDRSLEFPAITGAAGNARASHFEATTQQTINTTAWAPSPELAKKIGARIKKPDGQDLTDIDAIGEHGKTLLLVSCKSTIYSDRYDSGDYDSVRNIRTTIENAVEWWASIAEYLKENPK